MNKHFKAIFLGVVIGIIQFFCLQNNINLILSIIFTALGVYAAYAVITFFEKRNIKHHH